MSKAGEINRLSKLIKPEIGVITNIAEAHIENFKNIKGIAKAKGEILNNIKKGGTIILNRDDKFFNFLSYKAKLNNLKVVTFGKSKKADVFVKKIKQKNLFKEINISVKGRDFYLRIKDINIYNVLASLAIINELQLNFEKTNEIFKNLEPSFGRGREHSIKRYKKF